MADAIVKHLNFGSDAKDKIFEGISKLTKAVSSTLGASGQCVIMEDNQGRPIITKDGVTVANTIVIGWVKDALGTTVVSDTEAEVQAAFDVKKQEIENPTEADGLPWVEEEE